MQTADYAGGELVDGGSLAALDFWSETKYQVPGNFIL